MTRKLRILVIIVVALVVFGYAFTTYAQGTGFKLENPIGGAASTIPQFLSKVLQVMVMIALPIISLFIVYSGFLFVAARGNEEKLSVAKANFLYVIIGAILILGAWVLASLLGGTVAELTRGT
jgi:hypothetical protein